MGLRAGSSVPTDEAMRGFSAFADTDPLVAYHADFDRLFLERAARDALGVALPRTWIDAAWLAPALLDRVSGYHRPLDDWRGSVRRGGSSGGGD